jgi:hypothetical protein
MIATTATIPAMAKIGVWPCGTAVGVSADLVTNRVCVVWVEVVATVAVSDGVANLSVAQVDGFR